MTGFDLDDLIVGNGHASALVGTGARYTTTITPAASGSVTVDIPAGAAEDTAGNPSVAGTQFSIIASLSMPPVPVGTLPDQRLRVRDGAVMVDVASGFRDPDGDALTYDAVSSDVAVVTVSVAGSTMTMTPVAAGVATITVTATDASGSNTTARQRFVVTVADGSQFTDHPIRRGTPIRAIHFLELRDRIDALRVREGLLAFRWTDPTITAGVTPVKRVHLTQLRAALDEVYDTAERQRHSYTDAAVTARETAIRAAHLMELRAAVIALE